MFLPSPVVIENKFPKNHLERFSTPVKAGIIFVSMLVAVLVLYGSSLNNWWCCDDTQILKHAINFSPYEYFFVPEAWRALIPYSLTPWLTLSYDIDLSLFGFTPAGFYAHNLLTIALCAVLIYLIAKQWVDINFALGGALLFLVGSPIAVASQQLMVRHYIEGLLFYLLAFFLFVCGVRKDRIRLGWLAGLSFAIAASAKEIFLPLGLVLLLLPIGNFRRRLAIACPILLVMLLYVPWRWFMLGDVVGGYTPVEALVHGDLFQLLQQFTHIPSLLLATPGIWLVGGIALTGLFQAWGGGRLKSLGKLMLWVTLPICLLMPLTPLALISALDNERFLVAVWAAIALGTSVVLGNATNGPKTRLLALLAMAVLATTTWTKNRQMLATMEPIQAAYFAQGIQISSSNKLIIIYLTPELLAHYPQGLVDLRAAMGRADEPPLMVADEVELAEVSLVDRQVLRYDLTTRSMLDITLKVPEMLEQWRERLCTLQLSVEITYDGKAKSLHWQLGPHTTGNYVLLSKASRTSVPLRGTLRMEKRPEGQFRFRYETLEGGIAYTPLLSLLPPDERGVSRLSWQGNGGLDSAADKSACRGNGKR